MAITPPKINIDAFFCLVRTKEPSGHMYRGYVATTYPIRIFKRICIRLKPGMYPKCSRNVFLIRIINTFWICILYVVDLLKGYVFRMCSGYVAGMYL